MAIVATSLMVIQAKARVLLCKGRGVGEKNRLTPIDSVRAQGARSQPGEGVARHKKQRW